MTTASDVAPTERECLTVLLSAPYHRVMRVPRNAILVGAIVLFAVSPPAPVAAAYCTRRYTEREKDLSETRIAVLREIQQRMDAMRSARGGPARHVSDATAARFRTVAAGMVLRLEAAHERQRQLCARLDRRIIDRQATGRPVKPAHVPLIEAERQWLATGRLLQEITLKLGYVPDADEPLAAFAETRRLVDRVKTGLEETNTRLLESATALKDLLAQPNGNDRR